MPRAPVAIEFRIKMQVDYSKLLRCNQNTRMLWHNQKVNHSGHWHACGWQTTRKAGGQRFLVYLTPSRPNNSTRNPNHPCNANLNPNTTMQGR